MKDYGTGRLRYQKPWVALVGPAIKVIQDPPDFTLLERFDNPLSVLEFIESIGYWASRIELNIKRDRAQRWLLKVPIIILANATGLLAALHAPPLFLILSGFIVSACVTLDGIVNPGKLLVAHRRTLHDLRNLQIEVTTEWRTTNTEQRDSGQVEADIIRRGEKKRRAIADALRDAETMTPRWIKPVSAAR